VVQNYSVPGSTVRISYFWSFWALLQSFKVKWYSFLLVELIIPRHSFGIQWRNNSLFFLTMFNKKWRTTSITHNNSTLIQYQWHLNTKQSLMICRNRLSDSGICHLDESELSQLPICGLLSKFITWYQFRIVDPYILSFSFE